MMKTARAALFTLIIVGIAAYIGTTKTSPERQQIHVMEGDYPIYTSVEDMSSASDLVIAGTVHEILPTERIIPNTIPLEKLPPHKAERVGFLTTGMQIQVFEVLWGDSDLTGKNIVVKQMGGSLGNKSYVMKDQPLSSEGQTLLLFLKEVGEGSYAVTGGQQGRYLIQNEEIRSAAQSKESLSLPVVRVLNSSTLAQTKQSLRILNTQSTPH